jgi:hypothetical protein
MRLIDNLKKALTGDKKSANAAGPAEFQPIPSPQEAYAAALEAQRAEKDYYFRRDPYGPIADRHNFAGLNYYPSNLAYRFTLPLRRQEPAPLTFQTSTGDERIYYKIGVVEFEVEGQPARLAIYQSEEHDELFLPFRDATSGQETYGAGRYLEPELLPGGEVLVDFNLAYNPYCAYSDAFSCPLPPLENWLKVPIRAGEKVYESSGLS